VSRAGPPVAGLPVAVLLAGLVGAGATGCGEEEPAPAPPPAPEPEPPAPVVAGRSIADAHAFALVPTSEGALLVWGPPHTAGGGVRAVRLGPAGAALGAEQPVAPGVTATQRPAHVVEIEAASAGRAVGVIWVEDRGRRAQVRAARSPDGGRRFAPPEALGATADHPSGAGGRISAVAGDDGTIVVHHRIEDAACTLTEGRCARIDRHTVGGGDLANAVRDTSVQEIPHPCEPLVVGALHRAGSWFYALCAADPEPTTHALVIDPDPELATPVALHPGCTPAGLAPLDGAVAVFARCGAEARVAVLDERGERRARSRPARRAVRCAEGRPVLEVRAGEATHRLRLGAAVDHLEALLPEAIAPPGARAVWTGEALLVGVPQGHALSVRRYECERGDRFDRTDRP
jgi:hypothetical protein